MNILITGIAGFVGLTLTEELLSFKKFNIIGVDNYSYSEKKSIDSIKKRISFLNKDICDLKSSDLKKYGKISIIIHLAAIAPLPDNQSKPFESLKNNVAGLGNMLEIGRRLEIKKFIFISSGAVYERTKYKNKLSEKDEVNTVLMYPTSKIFGEKLCDIFNETYNLPTIKIRLFNLYGPKQNYTRKHPPLLSQLIKSVIKGEKITIYNLNKNIKRDYIYIEDLINLILKIIKDKDNKLPRLINACSGESLSVPDIIKKIEGVFNKKLKIEKTKNVSRFWGKYDELFKGKYKINDFIIQNEVYKKAEGNPVLLNKIIKRKPINFETGIRKCIEYAKKTI